MLLGKRLQRNMIARMHVISVRSYFYFSQLAPRSSSNTVGPFLPAAMASPYALHDLLVFFLRPISTMPLTSATGVFFWPLPGNLKLTQVGLTSACCSLTLRRSLAVTDTADKTATARTRYVHGPVFALSLAILMKTRCRKIFKGSPLCPMGLYANFLL